MLYEALLLLALVLIVSYGYLSFTGQRFPLPPVNQAIFQTLLLAAIGAYFVWFWTHGGATLAQKTWRIRVVMADGSNLAPKIALMRFILCCWMPLPGLLFAKVLTGIIGTGLAFASIPLSIMVATSLIYLRPDRQLPQDILLGTRVMTGSVASRHATS